MVLENAEVLDARSFVRAKDIVSGKSRYITLLLQCTLYYSVILKTDTAITPGQGPYYYCWAAVTLNLLISNLVTQPSGNQKLNLAFVANLFNMYPAMDDVGDFEIIEETREEKSKL